VPNAYLVVDGHSVIYAWPELRQYHQRQPRQARDHLIRELQAVHDEGTWAVTLIFDGKHGSPAVPDKAGYIVRYSPAGKTADSLIENLVATQSEKVRPQITVVTADQAERHVVESLGAFCVSPDWLALEIERLSANLSRVTSQVQKKARWENSPRL
jgi:uncharacterized protein